MTTQTLLYWLLFTNVVAFILVVYDKHLAESAKRRISEANLLGWMAVGGAMGGITASRLVRHKTRKQPFSSQMHTLLGIHFALLITWQLGWLEPVLNQLLALFGRHA